MIDWIDLSARSGSGTTDVTVTALPYSGDAPRSGYFIVSGSSKFESIEVVQDAPAAVDQYLSFKVVSGGSMSYRSYHSPSSTTPFSARTIQYSVNGGFWNSATVSTANGSTFIGPQSLNPGDVIRLKSTAYAENTPLIFGFVGTAKCELYGNILSLVYGDSFASYTTMPNIDYIFQHIFCNANFYPDSPYWEQGPESASTIVSAVRLALPLNTTYHCYDSMFYGQTLLRDAPALPSMTLTDYCYSTMFTSCKSLIVPPELPATTLAQGCYSAMFTECISMTTAPTLPASELVHGCYMLMFSYCTSLNYVKCLASSIAQGASITTGAWLRDVSATGTFIKTPNASIWTSGESGIPTGWTVEDYTPSRSTKRNRVAGNLPVAITETGYLKNNNTDWIVA